MQLTDAQRTAFKNDMLANANLIQVGSDAAIAIKDCPGIAGDPTYQVAIRDWYNLPVDYRVHRHNVTRVEVYKTIVPAADSASGSDSSWTWTGFKAQGVPEQNSWFEMFMGGCDFGNLNNRQGVLAIFGTAGNGEINRAHTFNVARRKATNFERLYVVAVPTPFIANTGNSTAARGTNANPDTLGIGKDLLPIAGAITTAMVADALTNG